MFAASGLTTEFTFTDTESAISTPQVSQAVKSYIDKSSVTSATINVTPNASTKDLKGIDASSTDSLDEETYVPQTPLSGITTSFSALASAAGSNGNKLSESDLVALLITLNSNKDGNDYSSEIAFVKKIIAKFSTLSSGGSYITSLAGVNDAQDYKTVTPEQTKSPVDISI